MGAYILHRLLLMIPTFFGILIITFGILRLNGITLAEQMIAEKNGAGGEGLGSGRSDRAAQGGSRNIENYIDRFRRSGNDLPALINLRGFWTKQVVTSMLRRAGDSRMPPSTRSDAEKGLWIAGHFAVEPLDQVLTDDSLKSLHPAASMAFSLCPYTSIDKDLAKLPSTALTAIQDRNDILHRSHFESLDDPAYLRKRQALHEVYLQDTLHWHHTSAAAWKALLLETGFVDFTKRLFTGRLWSETRQEYAFTVIGQKWYISFGLNFTSIILAWVISIPLGIRSARRNGSLEDRATTNALFILWSLPSFFIGTLLLHHLCTVSHGHQPWFPNRGLPDPDSMWMSTPRYLLDLLWHATLPLLVLSYSSFTSLSRYMRGNLLDQLQAEYVRTARAKGCSEDQVVYGHAVRNSLLTMITLSSSLLADLFGGFVIVEYIFSIPGLGSLLLDAARQQDAPLIMASTVISVALLLVGILVADLLYAVVDPRLRSRYG